MRRIRQPIAIGPFIQLQQFEIIHVIRRCLSTVTRNVAHVTRRKVAQIVEPESGAPHVAAADLVNLERACVGDRVARAALRLLVARPFAELVVRAEEVFVGVGADAVLLE